jgi:stearoyl-CoA desaturase (delta-9 desaturase)
MIEIIYTLIVTHLTIACVTLYLHRSQAHRAVLFHPVVAHFMRFWLWLTTGMTTKQWVAIHRKHHQVTDQAGDPHSPHIFGIWTLIFSGWKLYNDAAKDAAFVMQYGKGTPKDWIERRLYTPHHKLGILAMLAIDVALFGAWGLLIWGVQMIWIPFWAAGMINGVGHWWGYRNGQTRDKSRNISPWGIIVGGEELHNNHHLDPANPKLSLKPWEFDIGWFYIRILQHMRLAHLRS